MVAMSQNARPEKKTDIRESVGSSSGLAISGDVSKS